MRLPSHSGPYSEIAEYYSSLDIQILTEATHTHSAQYSYIGLHTSIVRMYVTMRATNAQHHITFGSGDHREIV